MDANTPINIPIRLETTDSKEFVDIAYKLGLFLPEGEDD